MKISKKLSIILASVAGVSTIAGGVMYGVGGNQTIVGTTAQGDELQTVGWINFNRPGMTFDEYMKGLQDTKKSLEDQIKIFEANPADPLAGIQIATLKKAIESIDSQVSMYNLAIAGVVIMSLGLAMGAITVALVILSKKSK